MKIKEVAKIAGLVYNQYCATHLQLQQAQSSNEELQNENVQFLGETEQIEEMLASLQE